MFGSGDNQFGKTLRAIIMIIVYIGMFIIIVFTPMFDNVFAKVPQLRYGMGAIFLIYGLFRAYRFWKTQK